MAERGEWYCNDCAHLADPAHLVRPLEKVGTAVATWESSSSPTLIFFGGLASLLDLGPSFFCRHTFYFILSLFCHHLLLLFILAVSSGRWRFTDSCHLFLCFSSFTKFSTIFFCRPTLFWPLFWSLSYSLNGRHYVFARDRIYWHSFLCDIKFTTTFSSTGILRKWSIKKLYQIFIIPIIEKGKSSDLCELVEGPVCHMDDIILLCLLSRHYSHLGRTLYYVERKRRLK